MLGVMSLGQVALHRHQLERGDAQALALEARHELPGEPAPEGVGLDQDEGSGH